MNVNHHHLDAAIKVKTPVLVLNGLVPYKMKESIVQLVLKAQNIV